MQKDIIRAALEHENGAAVLAKLERMVIVEVFNKLDGNQRAAAKNLGLNRGTLRKRLKDHGIIN